MSSKKIDYIIMRHHPGRMESHTRQLTVLICSLVQVCLGVIAPFAAALVAGTTALAEQKLESASQMRTIDLGWIGAITGPTAKYGAYEAAQLAIEDANKEAQSYKIAFALQAEDGRCSSKEALMGARRLLDVQRVRYLVGGHCSSESLAIAPIAQRKGVVMMAAITSSPKLSPAGSFVFRVTAPNTKGAQLLMQEARGRGLRRIVALYEETEYAEGLAQYVRDSAAHYGMSVVAMLGVAPGSSDFKAMVSRIRSHNPDAIYFSPQSPQSTVAFLRAVQEQSVSIPILGNEIAGNAVGAFKDQKSLFDRLVYPEPNFDRSSPALLQFMKRYKERFGSEVPYGFWSAEAYDAVRIVADTILRCGDDPERVRQCLGETQSYRGLSGQIGFDEAGDGIRHYLLMEIRAGVPLVLTDALD